MNYWSTFAGLLAALVTLSASHAQNVPPPDGVPVVLEAWINDGEAQRSMIQAIGVRFDRNVSGLISADILKVRHVETGAMVDLSGAILRYDPRNNSASWIIDRAPAALLTGGNYIAWLEVEMLTGEPRRAACADAGIPLDDFTFGFHQFIGDTDGDRDVDFLDSCVFRETWQQQFGNARYLSWFDFDLSDLVDENDRVKVATTYFTLLPAVPALHLFLRNDTGESATDNASSLYAFGFGSTGTATVASWRVSLNGGAFTDISTLVSGGAAVLNKAFVDQLNGGPLVPGRHSLRVEATSSAGAVLAADQVEFEYLGDAACAPYFTTTPPGGVSLGQVQAPAPLNLSNWFIERWPGTQGASRWVIAPDGLSAEQTVNAAPSALVSDQTFLNLRVKGTFRVDTTGDDDYMGFVFGYQNHTQFYVFDWKQGNQSPARRGMSIKRFDAGTRPFTSTDFFTSNNTPNMTILVQANDIGWKDFQDYEITLDFTPGRIAVEVREGGTLLDRLEAEDNTFTGGRFGFYNSSQDSVIYRGFTQEALNNFSFYTSKSIDPDGGTVSYSLVPAADGTPPPAGAVVNPANGTLIWQPSVEGTFPFALVATDNDGLTDTQRFNVLVTPIDLPPTVFITKTSPSVFPGEDVAIRVVATDDQQITRTRLFIDDVEAELDATGSFTTPFTNIGLVELRAVAIDSAQQVSEITSYIRVLNPAVPPPPNPNQTIVAPPGQTNGTPTDIRPLVSIQAPRSTNDDPTRFVGTVDANGGTLRNWFLEWAPLANADPANLSSPSVLWLGIAQGTTEMAAAQLATITPANFPNEPILFRLRAENTNGLGSMAGVAFNPRSANPTGSTGNTGTGTGARATAAFTAPLNPTHDYTRIRGTIGANGGTLRNWTLDYAPVSDVNQANLSDPAVTWSILSQGTTPVTDGLLATIDPATFPSETFVFRLTAVNESGLGTVTTLTYNPVATTFTTPGAPTGTNPATAARPVARITSPLAPGDDLTLLKGTVLANGGTLQRWAVDYAPRGSINPADLNDPAVAWTLLVEGTGEKTNESLTPLTNPVFQTGVWIIRLRAFNTNGLGSLASTLLDSGDQSVPAVAFTSPAADSDVTFITPVRGTVSSGAGILASWTLDYAPAEEVSMSRLNAASTAWVRIGSGTTPLTDQPLGDFDPTILRNGSYVLRLQAFNNNGRGFTDGRLVNVIGEAKIGNFRLEFIDLTVPLGGIPITVRRIYDTLDARRSGEFGFGWTLGLSEADIRETVPDTGESFYEATPFEVGTRVFITTPEGKRVGFTFNVRNPRHGFLYSSWEPYFIPDPGVYEKLTIAPSNFERVELDPSGAVYTLLLPFGYNPDRYQLTTRDGLVYDYDQRTGLKKITDRNSQNVSFARNAITHSSGEKVTLTRDSNGRITAITDPMGSVQRYAYDPLGDLRSHTDAGGNTSRYDYNRSHGLIQITDPLNRVVARNDYDDAGRLIRMTNANGRVINFSRDLDSRQEIITDAGGQTTVMEYDERGNVLRTTDARGGVTTNTYDADGNQLTTTNPEGETITRTFDSRRNLLTESNALGRTTTLTYNDQDKVTSRTDPLGRVSRFEYTATGNLREVIDAHGVVAQRNDYDGKGNLIARTDARGKVTQYEYNTKGQRTAITDAKGAKSTTQYNARGDVISETDRNGTTVHTEVDARGYFSRKTDPLGNVSRYTFNAVGVMSDVTDAMGNVARQEVDATGKDLSITDATNYRRGKTYDIRGNVTGTPNTAGQTLLHEYDELSRRVKTVSPDGGAEQQFYDKAGRLIRTVDARGNETLMEYDDAGRNTKRTDALGHANLFAYDAAGNLIRQTDARGNVFQFDYDALDRRIRTRFPDGTSAVTGYDAAGNVIGETDAAGHTTVYSYDPNGKLVAVIDPLGGQTRFEYDAEGNPLSQTDANGKSTRFAYDANGRRISKTYPDGTIERQSYDIGNRIASVTDAEGRVTVMEYDAAGRPIRKNFPGGTTESFSYTPAGMLLSATNAGGTVQYGYDANGRLTRVTNADGSTITYGYDLSGNRTSVTTQLPGGPSRLTAYTFDKLDRIATVTDPEGAVMQYSYDEIGNLASATYPNGVVSIYTYDALSRLSLLTHRKGATVLASYSYVVNAVGDRTRVTAADMSFVEYDYDALRRLTRESHFNPGGTKLAEWRYTYDPVGNRRAVLDLAGSETLYTYDAADKLLSAGSTAFAYDARGNMISRNSPAGSTAYAFNSENELTGVNAPAGSVEFAYDARGERIRSNGPAGMVRHLVDPSNATGVSQVVADYDDSGAALAEYTYGYELLGQRRNGATHFHHRDGSRNVRLLSDSAGNATDTYAYNAFGERLSRTGSTSNPYQFAGDRYGELEGLTFLRARYYDPSTGRFISKDPFEGVLRDPVSLHRYLYANANPVAFIDPTGLMTYVEVKVSMAIGAIASLSISLITGDTILQAIPKAIIAAGFAAIGGPAVTALGVKIASSLAGTATRTALIGLSIIVSKAAFTTVFSMANFVADNWWEGAPLGRGVNSSSAGFVFLINLSAEAVTFGLLPFGTVPPTAKERLGTALKGKINNRVWKDFTKSGSTDIVDFLKAHKGGVARYDRAKNLLPEISEIAAIAKEEIVTGFYKAGATNVVKESQDQFARTVESWKSLVEELTESHYQSQK